MTEWPDELLHGLDVPRPLPPELRARFEDALAAVVATEEDAEIEAVLVGLDVPRPLAPHRRQALADALVLQGRRPIAGRHRALGVAAAALVLAGAVTSAALVVGRSSPPTGSAARSQHVPSAAGRAGQAAQAPLSSTTVPVPLAGPGNTFNSSSAGTSSGGGNGAAEPAGIAPAVPTVSELSPAAGPASGGTTVLVTGTGFVGVTAVNFGVGHDATFTVLSPTEIRVVTPAHGVGTVDIVVQTSGGTSATGPGDRFTYES